MNDLVYAPAHYTFAPGFEPLDFIDQWKLDFRRGSAVKYIARAAYKGSYRLDLQKAENLLRGARDQVAKPDDLRMYYQSAKKYAHAWCLPPGLGRAICSLYADPVDAIAGIGSELAKGVP